MPAVIVALECSLAGSHPKDSIVRKLYALLSQCHRRAGDQPKAIAASRAGREIYPDDAELLFIDRTASDLRGHGPPGEAEAECLLGRGLTTRGEHALAREVLERAAARFPSSVPVWAALSYCLLEGGADPVGAEAALREVLRLDPENVQAKRNLEALYRNTGRWVEGAIDHGGEPT